MPMVKKKAPSQEMDLKRKSAPPGSPIKFKFHNKIKHYARKSLSNHKAQSGQRELPQ